MNLPPILNIAIGLFFVYLLLSLLVSDLQEFISSYFWDGRARILRQSIQTILGERMAQVLYEHPLIQSLKTSKLQFRQASVGPSYIPNDIFALSLIDIILEQSQLSSASEDLDANSFIAALKSAELQNDLSPEKIHLLQILAKQAHHTQKSNLTYLKALEQEIITWFSQAMDRSSGIYKRQVKWMTMLIGFVLAVLINADTLNIATRLGNEPILRENLVERVALIYQIQNYTMPAKEEDIDQKNFDALVRDTTLFLSEFSSLPIGWSSSNLSKQFGILSGMNTPESVSFWQQFELSKLTQAFLGWSLTAIATSMGSSFWFDLLNKIINVRGTGNKPTYPSEMMRPRTNSLPSEDF